MKQVRIVLLIAVMLILVACQGQATPTATPTQEVEPSPEAVTVETAEATEAVEATEAAETVEATEAAAVEATAEATEAAETVEATEATEAAAETVEATEAAAEVEETAEATEAAEAVTPEATEAAEAPAAEATGEAAAIEPWVCPDDVLNMENKTLNILNWATYIAEDTIPNFEAACGVTVTTDFYGSNEELLSRLRAGNPGFDIIVPSDYAVAQMIEEDLLEPITKENIPNYANLNPALLDRQYDPGNVYSIPYQWGTIGIGYNVNTVKETLGDDVEITSWNQVFDYPEPRVAWLDDPRSMLGIALILLGHDPNSTNPDEIQEAADFLIEKGRENVQRLAADDGQELLARGEVDMVIEYSGDIFQVALACEEDANCDTEYAYALPEEGSNLWVDNMAIPAGAQNHRLAEAFIDYVLHPQIGADISNYIAYASPNQASIDAGLIDESTLNSPIIYPSQETIENLFTINAFPDDPDAQQAYNDAWDALKIQIGR